MLAPLSELTPQQRAIRQYTAITAETCRRDLRKFVRKAWPLVDPKTFVSAWHIDAICEHLAYVALGDIRYLIINVPPRMTKSSIVSALFPAWVWTNEPHIQFLTASYAADLSRIDAVKNRRIIESAWYQSRYPISILADENRADRFGNSAGGYRASISVGSKTTGLGGDIKILDDPHNAVEVESDKIRKQAIDWHDNAWKSRNNDPNTVRTIMVGQRTHDGDIFGHVTAIEPSRWVQLVLPMEYDGARKCVTYRNKGQGPIGEPIFKDPREVPNALLNPERFDADTCKAEKEATPARTWASQFQQQPEGAGGRILKRKWWRKWGWPDWHPLYRKEERPLPELTYLLQSYDTAFEQGEEDSFTVRTTWGMFYHEEDRPPVARRRPGDPDRKAMASMQPKVSAILLERKKWRPGFGEMRDEAVDSYNNWEEWGYAPDRVLIEKKASGHDLYKELRLKKLPVRPVLVHGDLVYRAHMASLPLEKGSIWYLERAWAKDLIEECAKFPDVDFNDQVSSCCIAWMYMRRFMDLELEDDDQNEEDLALFSPKLVRRSGYYG